MSNIHSSLRKAIWIPAAFLAAACASIGNPSGGPRDEEPPRFVRSSPEPDAVDFHGDEIQIYFDELVNVKDAFSKVIMSPPSAQTPRISSLGRRVTVKFQDTLRSNTTYTIDFGDAIEDNNEGNPLQNFSFTFSTGPQIDTLGISGMVLGAEDLEPMQGKLVGLHSNLADSALRKLTFDYVARTDDRGRFSFQGLRPGVYRVFALDDADADKKYSSPEEAMAFYDVSVSPTVREIMVSDTIRNLKTGEVDTVVGRRRYMRLPNDLLLRYSTSRFRQQYLSKYERIDTTRLSFIFNSPSETTPTFSVIGAPRMKGWAVEERSPGCDTITLWLRPRSLVSADTLHVAVNFLAADSAGNPVMKADTLRMTFDRKKHERIAAQARKNAEKKFRQEHKGDSAVYEEPEKFLGVTIDGGGPMDVDRPLTFETETPLERLDTLGFRLEEMRDSIWHPIAVRPVMPDSLQPRNFRIDYPWKFDTQYRLHIDSLAMEGIYGTGNKSINHEFKTRAENDYSSLRLRIVGLGQGIPAFVELLNQDNPVRRVTVEDGMAFFPYLQPGKYYLRLYEDFNGNGRYDPADYDKGMQPDVVFYYPKAVNLKKNWSKDETWDVFATAVDLQKPEAIRKNKPKERRGVTPPKKNSRQQEEEEEEE